MIQEKYGHYHLKSYEPLTLTLPSFEVTEEELTAEVERIAARHATNVTVEPHPVQADDMLLIDIQTTEGRNVFPGLTHDSVDVRLGVGMLPAELEQALLGHEVGEVVEADALYLDYSQVAADKEVPADGGCGAHDVGEPEPVSIHSVVKILAQRRHVVPEVTDAWVAENIALCETEAEFREKTRRRLRAERQRKYANEIEYRVIEELGGRLEDAVPHDAVEGVEKQLYREFDRFLERYDLDRPSYLAIQGVSDIEFAQQVAQDARDRVAQDIALASWATHFDVTIQDEDVDFLFGEPTPERTYEARVEAEQTGQIDTFRDLALRAKVAELIARDARYLAPDGSPDEGFGKAVERRYEKLRMVREHATGAPMTAPPLVMRGAED